MKRIVFILGIFISITGCSTNWNFENTGLAEEHFDGNMYEYLKSDSYNWDSIRLIIERAELIPLFEGDEALTFIGPTNHSVRKWMNKQGISSIEKIEKDVCVKMVKDHLFAGRILRDDIAWGQPKTQEAGKIYTALSGKEIWMCVLRDNYGSVIEGGAKVIYLRGNVATDVASSNIQPTNGIVHSLNYNYVFGSL